MVKSGLNPQLNVKKNPNADCYLTKRVFMKLPKQSLPVNRREILEPNLVLVKFRDSKGKLQQKYNFVEGSNVNLNDPVKFSEQVDCGCQIFSGLSRAMCFATCGIV